MGYYHTALVCKNGHMISDQIDASPNLHERFCSKCGAETLSKCVHCSSNIRGDYEVEGIVTVGFRTPAPTYCFNCGKPFPWTEEKLKVAEELLTLTELQVSERADFTSALQDVSIDGPRTKIGALKIKSFLSKIRAKDIKDGLLDVVKQIGVTEAVKLISGT